MNASAKPGCRIKSLIAFYASYDGWVASCSSFRFLVVQVRQCQRSEPMCAKEKVLFKFHCKSGKNLLKREDSLQLSLWLMNTLITYRWIQGWRRIPCGWKWTEIPCEFSYKFKHAESQESCRQWQMNNR